MGETWNKKEREKKRQKNKQEKAERKQERREQSKDKSMDDMMAYLDENGNLTSTPPDPGKKVEFKLEDIEIGVPKQAPPTQEELLRKGKVSFFNDTKASVSSATASPRKASSFISIISVNQLAKTT